MASANETTPLPADSANDGTGLERLHTLLRELQEECARLRQTLTKTEIESNRYRQAFLEQARTTREFENLDIPTLESMSAGPVEMID